MHVQLYIVLKNVDVCHAAGVLTVNGALLPELSAMLETHRSQLVDSEALRFVDFLFYGISFKAGFYHRRIKCNGSCHNFIDFSSCASMPSFFMLFLSDHVVLVIEINRMLIEPNSQDTRFRR
jgi:hypothetical protein